MQRLFSTFADGWPGAGLLLLRLLTGVTLIISGMVHVDATSSWVSGALQMIGIAAGIALIFGLFTPVACSLATIAKTSIAISQFSSHSGNPWLAAAQAVLAAGLAMIGPGAWSIDAHRFGRKHIDIPGR